jgi:exopolyphosphatase / guanosine-5'-triphosphate,3'-diphosphate pyrophosphatase
MVGGWTMCHGGHMRVGAIDCGTNSIRLLIAEADERGVLQDVVRQMRIVRLGEGVDRTGVFAPAALERTFAACAEYRDLLTQHPVERLRFVATSASRDVSNRAEFFRGVEERLGIQPEVIAGETEAELTFAGAVQGFAADAIATPILVVDIGGGSTEFVLGDTRPWSRVSVNIGCVRMTERHLFGDPATGAEIAAVRSDVRAAIAEARLVVPVDQAATVIGVAGTVTTVAAMALDLAAYDPEILHGARISRAQVDDAAETLLGMTKAERGSLAFMHPGRVDVIGGGALVLSEVLRATGAECVIASEHDILDGIAASCM